MTSVPPAVPRVDDPLVDPLDLVGDGLDLEQVLCFREQGFVVLEDLFEDDLLDRVVEETRGLFDPEVADGPRSRIRVQDVWDECPAVRELACDERILSILRRLYGREPIPFQTLDFQYGTEQAAHQDRMFFSSLPADFMCGVWVALEDVGLANGTLFYHPGSHRLPEALPDTLGLPPVNLSREGAPDPEPRRLAVEANLREALRVGGFPSEHLEAKRGTTLLWAAGIAHGGSPIGERGRTRRSQVTHYFFADCLYTTPLYSNHFAGDLYLRRVVDVRTGEPVVHRYGGLPVEGVEGNGFYKLLLASEHGRDFVRAVDQTHVRDHRRILEDVLASPSYRLGRALTAPLRWFRR